MPTEFATTIFYSYSHQDEDLKDKLDAHLSSLRREGLIRTWHDRRISPGSDWAAEIDEHAATADIFLALVSADFINSDYCWGAELTQALARHARGEATVVPVIARPVDWRNTPLGSLQALPKDGRAVTTWGNRDEGWTNVATGLRTLIHSRHLSPDDTGGIPLTPSAGRVSPRSGDRLISFSHINIMADKLPRWRESAHEHYSKPHVIEKKKSARAASKASG
jgi:hypothetical protein